MHLPVSNKSYHAHISVVGHLPELKFQTCSKNLGSTHNSFNSCHACGIIQLLNQMKFLNAFIFNYILININTWKGETCPSQKDSQHLEPENGGQKVLVPAFLYYFDKKIQVFNTSIKLQQARLTN